MKVKESALIVVCKLLFPIIFIKAYKNQQIAHNETVLKWRAVRAQFDENRVLDQDYIMVNEVPAQ